MNYKSNRIIDGKPKWVIVDDSGKIIDKNPDKDSLKKLDIEPKQKRSTNMCDICGIYFDDAPSYGHPHREYI